jgi:general secretion pathway protein H
VPRTDAGDTAFRFVGLPASRQLPQRWLDERVTAQVVGDTRVRLGPDALIGAQRILLRLEQQRLELVTDGLGPFRIADDTATPS